LASTCSGQLRSKRQGKPSPALCTMLNLFLMALF